MFKWSFKTKSKDAAVTDDDAQVKLLNNTGDTEHNFNATKASEEASQSDLIQFDLKVTFDQQDAKAQMIAQILEQHKTLSELFKKVSSTKEKTDRLKSENQILDRYMQSLVAASSVLQPLNK